MDENKLQATLHALEWEARYRKRAAGQDTGSAFLKEIDGLDADFAEALSKFGLKRGKLLEIGAGLGDQAVQYARRGFDVTATEVSDTALAQGAELASRHGVAISFVNDNILLTRLKGVFDVIADRGCYTIQPRGYLGHYARNAAHLLAADGYMLLKVDKQNEDKLAALQTYFEMLDSFDSHYRKGYGEADKHLPHNAVFTVLRHRAATKS